MTESYKVTNQLYDATSAFAAQKDAMPNCDRRPTSLWLAGEVVIDRYEMAINADAKPGTYSLYTAMYDEASGARLPVLNAAGNPLDDKVKITDLTIAER